MPQTHPSSCFLFMSGEQGNNGGDRDGENGRFWVQRQKRCREHARQLWWVHMPVSQPLEDRRHMGVFRVISGNMNSSNNKNGAKVFFPFVSWWKFFFISPHMKLWSWGFVFLPEPQPGAVQLAYPARGPGRGEERELMAKLHTLLWLWVCQEKGVPLPIPQNHLLVSQCSSLDCGLSTCPDLGRTPIQTSRDPTPDLHFCCP